MNNIHLFSKISAIFVAFILVTTPIASALATGYNLNEEAPSDAADYGDTYEYAKSPQPESYPKADAKTDNNKNGARDDENYLWI